jgi:mannose-6-phosphate isomerase
MDRRPFLLTNPIQNYAWGSHSAIAALQGRAPSEQPEAEEWIGAHTNAPSIQRTTGLALDRLIRADPAAALGNNSRRAFGETLPFLLKVLAAGSPLSLQAHPSRAQAIAGFEAEELAGVQMTDPKRVFKDRNHKPELICALTDFEAMCGFRPVQQTAALLEALATPTTTGMAARIRANHPAVALRDIVVDLLQADSTRAERTVADVVNACAIHTGAWAGEADLAVRLAAEYPGDVGAIISLLLNRVELKPGEALMLPAGNLHAYIRGVGVELMANSDNVLRGGLTPKHVDVPGLINVVDWNPLTDPVIRPAAVDDSPGIMRYPSPSDEFRLDVVTATADHGIALVVDGPELLWCHTGSVSVTSPQTEPGDGSILHMKAGEAAFVPAAASRLIVRGDGTLFRATVGL